MYKIYNELKNKLNSKCILIINKNTLLFFVKEIKLI